MFEFMTRVRLLQGLFCALMLLSAPARAAEPAPEVHVIAYGLFGDLDVFEKEARQAASIVARRFGARDVVVRFNTRSGGIATAETLRADLMAVASRFKTKKDVLFLILTSHGSQVGVRVKAGAETEAISAAELREMLESAGIVNRIVVISACYSGIYVPALANPNSLTITAADPNNTSFGCQAGVAWTWFGDAFFNRSLPHAASLEEAFYSTRDLIYSWETTRQQTHSNPQIAGGESLLDALERPKAPPADNKDTSTTTASGSSTTAQASAANAPGPTSEPAAFGCALRPEPAPGTPGLQRLRRLQQRQAREFSPSRPSGRRLELRWDWRSLPGELLDRPVARAGQDRR